MNNPFCKIITSRPSSSLIAIELSGKRLLSAFITCDPEINLREVDPARHDTVKRVFHQRACQFRPSTCIPPPLARFVFQVNTTFLLPGSLFDKHILLTIKPSL